MGRRNQARPQHGWFPNLIGISGRRLATVALVLLTASIAVNFGELVVRGADIQQKIERQRELNDAHRAEQAQLKAQLAFYQSDIHMEMVAREQLGYAREGDVVIFPSITLSETEEVAPAPAPLPAPERTLNWMRWWQALAPPPAE
jgi:cell division protein FtsB